MSMTFTKLFSSITESSIWMQDDHTRIVWITTLAMADKRGRVIEAILARGWEPGLPLREFYLRRKRRTEAARRG